MTPAPFRWPALVALIVSAALAMVPDYPSNWHDMILAGSWISVIITALCAYRKPDTSNSAPLVLAANAGFWAGAVSGTVSAMLQILPLILLVFPAHWIVGRGGAILLKLLASWLIAIAILIAALPMVQTPGYVEDHMQ